MDVLLSPAYAAGWQQLAAWIGCALLAACAYQVGRRGELSAGFRRGVVLALACTAVLACWANFFQSRNNGQWIHRWDLFHTVVGAKYFDQLGYDHLYDCAYLIASEARPQDFTRVKKIRDLGTLKSVSVEKLREHDPCGARFDAAQRAAFASDVIAFGEIGLRKRWHEVFRDKGYNGTPFYTWIVRAVFDRVAITYPNMLGLALIDLALLAAACFVVARTRGLLTGLAVLTLLATCFPARFEHMGGSFLRSDYIAALMLAVCALARGRNALGGALLAYATLVRAFPALFAVAALLAFAARALDERRVSREAVFFALGYGITLIALGSLTFAGGHGTADWAAWWTEVREHTTNSAAFRVGFKHMFMLDGNLFGDHGFVPFAEKTKHFASRRIFYYAASALLLIPVLLRARRMDVASFTALFGTLAFFVLLIATRYYYAVLVLPLLVHPETFGKRGPFAIGAALFGASALTYAIALANGYAAFLYNTVTSMLLAILAVALVLATAITATRNDSA